MKRKILKVLLWLLGVFLLLVMVCLLFLYVNREKVKAIIVTEVNKQLVSPIKVSSIRVDFFSTFPKVSLAFDDVLAYDAFPKRELGSNQAKQNIDTLFYFKKLYLSFDFWDVISDKYEINRITLKEGQFNMRVKKNGDVNYIFWKENATKKDSHFSLSLKKVSLQEIKFSYKNDYIKQYYELFLTNAIAKGNFSDKEQKIIIRSKSKINNIQIDNLHISNNRAFDFDIIISNNTITKLIKVSKGGLSIDGLGFELRGNLNYKEIPLIDISINSDKVRLEDMINLLPENYKRLFKDFKGSGELVFNLNMYGKLTNMDMPSISSKFYIKNGELINKKLDIIFTNINLQGNFSNGEKRNTETSYINLDNFSFLWNKGKVKGYAQLFNFSNLSIDTKLDCDLPLDMVHRFIQNKEITTLSGNLNLNLKLSGDIKSLSDISNKGFSEIRMEGRGYLKAFNYSDTRLPQSLKNINTNFVFNNSIIDIESFNGYAGKSAFNFRGRIEDILPFVFKQKPAFNIIGNLNIGTLKLSDWIQNKESKKEGNKNIAKGEKVEKGSFGLPEFFNADIITDIAKLTYQKTEIEKFHSRVKLINGNLILEEMNFLSYGGGIKGNISLILKAKTPKVFGNMSITNIDAKKFLYAMNEFGQNVLTSSNVSGNVNAEIEFSSELNKNLDIEKERLFANIKYRIENGEIKDVPILKKLSYFVDESALNNVKFEAIESSLGIQNSCINLDEVNVKSNAISFSLLGKHNFNNSIDYKARIKLSELSSKNKKAKLEKQRKEFGDFEEDENAKMTLFVKIAGTVDKPIFSYDFKKNLEKTKQILRTDKEKLIKSVDKDLKLGIEQMKKDKANWKKQEKGEYIIEWEEGNKWDTIEIKKEKNHKKETKFEIEWE